MRVGVLIPTALQQNVGNEESLEIEGTTMDRVVNKLLAGYRVLKPHLLTDDGNNEIP